MTFCAQLRAAVARCESVTKSGARAVLGCFRGEGGTDAPRCQRESEREIWRVGQREGDLESGQREDVQYSVYVYMYGDVCIHIHIHIHMYTYTHASMCV